MAGYNGDAADHKREGDDGQGAGRVHGGRVGEQHELEILRQGGGGAVSGSIGEIQKHLEAVKDLIVEGRK